MQCWAELQVGSRKFTVVPMNLGNHHWGQETEPNGVPGDLPTMDFNAFKIIASNCTIIGLGIPFFSLLNDVGRFFLFL